MTKDEFQTKLRAHLESLHCITWLSWEIAKPDGMQAAIDTLTTLWEQLEPFDVAWHLIPIKPWYESTTTFTYADSMYDVETASFNVMAGKMYDMQKTRQQDTPLYQSLLKRISTF